MVSLWGPEDSTGNSALTPAQGTGGRVPSLQAEVRDQEVGRSQSPFACTWAEPTAFLAGS